MANTDPSIVQSHGSRGGCACSKSCFGRSLGPELLGTIHRLEKRRSVLHELLDARPQDAFGEIEIIHRTAVRERGSQLSSRDSGGGQGLLTFYQGLNQGIRFLFDTSKFHIWSKRSSASCFQPQWFLSVLEW